MSSSEELLERCEISGLRGVDERVDESLLLGGADLPARFARDAEAGTGDELPRVRLTRRENVRDLLGESFSMTMRSASSSASRRSAPSVGSARRSTGSAARGSTDVSRRTRADCATLSARRFVVVARNAAASRTLLRSVPCQRIHVSCTTSSASAALSSVR
jgi:hypothetical protein